MTEINENINKLLKKLVDQISPFTEWARNNKNIEKYIASNQALGKAEIITADQDAQHFAQIVLKTFPSNSIVCDFGGGSVQV